MRCEICRQLIISPKRFLFAATVSGSKITCIPILYGNYIVIFSFLEEGIGYAVYTKRFTPVIFGAYTGNLQVSAIKQRGTSVFTLSVL